MDSNNISGNLLPRRVCKYDVFISFRGTDTRNSFTDHLYSHLIRKGIFVFKDDKRLQKGEPISSQLLEAIKDSRVSIVVFSKDYAASTWCLDEMAAIVDCQKEFKQTVFPVFYDVDPSHVRKQTGVYENSFLLHAEKFKQLPDKVGRWKRAMTDLANSAGLDVRDKRESKAIECLFEKGATNVEAIVLHEKEDASRFRQLRAQELSKMRELKLLIFHHKNFSGRLNFLSNNLHYLLWHDYPFTSLPSNFAPDKLVELSMCNSNVKRLWEGIKHLPCLKRMDLSNSKCLIETPHFDWIPNLERLDLSGCTKLSRVHPSIGFLKILAFLSLRNCSSLVSLDFVLGFHLSLLRILLLSGCTKLERTPNFTGLSNLEHLDLEECTSLSTVDDSIGALAMLKFFSLRNCTNLGGIPDSLYKMTSLQTLDLCCCLKLSNLPPAQKLSNISIESLIYLDMGFCNLREVPECFGWLRCLERLNLEGNNFGSVPFSNPISKLSSLSYLNLSHCHKLLQYDCFLSSGDASSAGRYFKMVSQSRNHRSGLYFFDCPNICWDVMGGHIIDRWLTRLVEEPRHFRCGFDIIVPGTTIPNWFHHQFTGGSTIIVKSCMDDNWIGFVFCVAFEVNSNCGSPTFDSSHPLSSSGLPHPLYLSFESEHVEESFNMPLHLELYKIDGSKHVWAIYISRPHCHFVKTGAHISFKARPGLKITKWGLSMIFCGKNINQRRAAAHKRSGRKGHMFLHFYEEDHLLFYYLDESSSSCSGPKIQLPYNWFVTEEEEKESREAKAKENNLSNIGL